MADSVAKKKIANNIMTVKIETVSLRIDFPDGQVVSRISCRTSFIKVLTLLII